MILNIFKSQTLLMKSVDLFLRRVNTHTNATLLQFGAHPSPTEGPWNLVLSETKHTLFLERKKMFLVLGSKKDYFHNKIFQAYRKID